VWTGDGPGLPPNPPKKNFLGIKKKKTKLRHLALSKTKNKNTHLIISHQTF
jgi:hypothetical protein